MASAGTYIKSSFFQATALTGGTDGALDQIPGSVLQNGDRAEVVYNGATYVFKYNATSTTAEDSPNVIAPDSGSGRWILIGISRPYAAAVTFAEDDATPAVTGGKKFKTANSNATTITDFDGGEEGQEIFVLIGDDVTTIDFTTGTALLGNAGADWTPETGDFLTAIYEDGIWYCTCVDTTAAS